MCRICRLKRHLPDAEEDGASDDETCDDDQTARDGNCLRIEIRRVLDSVIFYRNGRRHLLLLALLFPFLFVLLSRMISRLLADNNRRQFGPSPPFRAPGDDKEEEDDHFHFINSSLKLVFLSLVSSD